MFEKLTAALPRRVRPEPPSDPAEPVATATAAAAAAPAPAPAHSDVAPGHVRLRVPQFFVVQEGRGLSDN